MNTEIAIIGGGASGLAAGAVLSRANKRSIITERNPRVGKKLLATGNGRCNLGHVPLEMSAYHGDVEFAKQVFADWKGAESFFADLGLICKADSEGRLYPYSNTANSVLDSLRRALTVTEVLTETECRSIVLQKDGFLINGNISAKKVIWACGNAEFSLLEKLGHTVATPFPALCPIIVDKALTRSLKGLRQRACARAIAGDKTIKEEYGEVQFNDGSLSGICIMNLSRLVRDYGNSLTISLDIAPEFTVRQLRSIPLSGLFHSRIVQELEKKPLETVKDWRFQVSGVAPWNQSQVMSGGVFGSELNLDLSSKVCPNLYITGEAINVDGDCGGYNLEWAWATGNVAANACIL